MKPELTPDIFIDMNGRTDVALNGKEDYETKNLLRFTGLEATCQQVSGIDDLDHCIKCQNILPGVEKWFGYAGIKGNIDNKPQKGWAFFSPVGIKEK